MYPKLGQSLDSLSFSLFISFRQEQFWVRNFDNGVVILSLHLGPYVLEVVSSGYLLGILAKVIPIESPGSVSHPRSLGLSREFPPPPTPTPSLSSCIFPFILLAF
jgi:hypothetical protein